MELYKSFWKNYTNFSGRTSRKDFWMTYLYQIIALIAVAFISGFIGGLLKLNESVALLPYTLFVLASLIPMLSIEVRRLHDINKSGWFLLLSLIPFVGGIIVLVFLCLPSVNENNNFGTDK